MMEKILFCVKKTYLAVAILFFATLTTTKVVAQAVNVGINYQAIARDNTTGLPFADTTINVKFSIWNAPNGGTMHYSEEHLNIQTNKYGLFTLVIGNGTNQVNDFDTIPWTTSNKYLEVAIALVPNSYITMPSRNAFQGVPYAHVSKWAVDSWDVNGNIVGTDKFIGTKNTANFVIKTDNDTSMVIAPNGDVAINRGNLGVGMAPVASSAIAIKNGQGNEIEFNTTTSEQANIVSNSILNIGTSTVSDIQFKINNSAKVLIDTIGRVGIGTQTPTAKLSVNGTVRIADTLTVQDPIKITDGTEGAGKILTSDATGLASWQTLSLGTVTKVTADSLLPLFTTQVQNDTTTPHIEFSLNNAAPFTVFGNNSAISAAPDYFNPILASSLFQNQGATNQVLHGDASGIPTWGQIQNADIATGAVNLTTQVSGVLPIANGGTNTANIGTAGSVAYSNGSAYNFTSQGTDGQVLESTGIGTPVWRKRVINIVGDTIITATTSDTSNYTLSVAMNSAKHSGVVLKGDPYPNMVWKTDALGNPAWRNDSSGVNYTMGTGLSLTGTTINSVWTQNNNNIYNNNTANVGIGTNNPVNKLDVEGGVAIGANYSGLSTAPSNGAIIEGKVGIGTINPLAKLYTTSSSTTESVGYFENTNFASPVSTLVATSNGNSAGNTFFASNTGAGRAINAVILNPASAANAIESSTNGSGDAINATNSGTAGRAGTFRITNAANTANSALNVNSAGTGKAGHFTLTSTSNTAPSLLAETAGSGEAIQATNTGTGRAGKFEITNSASSAETFYVSTNGTGKGGVFKLTNASNASDALAIETAGTGRVGSFINTNSANTSDAVFVTTNGSASTALKATNTGQGSSVTNTAGYFETNGSGTGNTHIAGYFSASGGGANYAGIFANGNVGIGTATPTSPLHVKYNSNSITDYGITLSNNNNGANAFTSILLVNDANVTGGISLNSSGNTTASGASGMNIGTNAATKLQLGTNNLPRLTVDGSGNVGIGTIIPSSLLHVNGTIRMGSSIANGSLIFNNTTNTTQTVTIQTGATSASYTLTLPTVQGATNSILANNGSGVLSWVTAGSLGAWANVGNAGTVASTNFIGTTDAVDFVARTNNLERLRIASGGNVGIGTNSPVNMLDVEGKVAIGAAYSGSSAAPENGLIVQGNVGLGITTAANKLDVAGGVAIGTNFVTGGANQAPANGAMIEGDVRIGTTDLLSTAKLHIVNNVDYANEIKIENSNSHAAASSMVSFYNNSGIGKHAFIYYGSSISNAYAGNNGLAIGTASVGKMEFYTKNAARVTIDTAGNVGIGTDTPSSKLEVNGSIASAVASYPTFSGGASYTLDGTNSIVIITGTGTGATTFTLPLANTCPGRIYYFKNVSTASTVSLSKSGGDTIDNSITYTIIVNGGAILASDGVSKWYIIGKY